MKRTPMTRSTPLRRSTGAAVASVPIFKAKTCKVCRLKFTPTRTMQPVCAEIACGVAYGEKLIAAKKARARADTAKAERAQRKADKARLQEMQPLGYWVKKAQEAFNRYVRLRDITAGHGCIDCGKPFEPERPGGAVDAGHYLSRGSAPHLKLDERNCFAQRKNCNRPGGTTRDAFRAGVVARIGLAAVESLESDQSVKQYRADDLKQIITTYRAKARAIEKAAA